ncbi:hypothetical protein B0O80DRAFT_434598 [Mortierella sp. GBAus27b]|nr:hypothetical protein B0O80DRAFT_434598 [Mortierella sp. GBAus27b]
MSTHASFLVYPCLCSCPWFCSCPWVCSCSWLCSSLCVLLPLSMHLFSSMCVPVLAMAPSLYMRVLVHASVLDCGLFLHMRVPVLVHASFLVYVCSCSCPWFCSCICVFLFLSMLHWLNVIPQSVGTNSS